MQVHQFSSLFLARLGKRSLFFSDIDEALCEPVSILNVVSTSTPDPVLLKGFGSSCSGTTTVGQLSISTGSSNRVNYSGRCDGMSEGGLTRGCFKLEGWGEREDRERKDREREREREDTRCRISFLLWLLYFSVFPFFLHQFLLIHPVSFLNGEKGREKRSNLFGEERERERNHKSLTAGILFPFIHPSLDSIVLFLNIRKRISLPLHLRYNSHDSLVPLLLLPCSTSSSLFLFPSPSFQTYLCHSGNPFIQKKTVQSL